jgi:metal-dependent amidase/aminoacylase/carboxypeptidase family protein
MCRSVSADRLFELRRRVNTCFEAGTLATGAEQSIEDLGHPFSHMVSDPDLLAHYRDAASALGRHFEHEDTGPPPTFSTDMGNVSLVVPTIHPLLGIPTEGAVNHQPAFTRACITPAADQAVLDGALALADTAVRVAQDAPLRARLLGDS